MEILNIYPNPERSEWAALTERCTRREEEITRQVASILDEVRTGGDWALRDITRRIEGRDCETFEVPADVRRAAAALIPEALKEALATAKANIEAFHRAQLPPEVSVEPMPGVRCVQRALPIRRVGLYIPGGKAPLFSTVLMLAVPARVAGCPEVVLCTPDPDRLYDALIAAGVIVRNRSRIPGCEGCLRITVGTPEENVRMLETVKNFTL